MEFTGEYRIPARREEVWAALNDPEVLKRCIPGCEALEQTSENELEATVMAKVGPVKARFTGKVTLSDLYPPVSYTITGEGQGGVAGFASGSARVELAEHGAETVLTYRAQATVGGKLAQIGSRLIDGTARKMADEFFTAFAEIAGGPAAEAAPAEAPAAEEKAGLAPLVWTLGVIALVLLSLWYYSSLG